MKKHIYIVFILILSCSFSGLSQRRPTEPPDDKREKKEVPDVRPAGSSEPSSREGNVQVSRPVEQPRPEREPERNAVPSPQVEKREAQEVRTYEPPQPAREPEKEVSRVQSPSEERTISSSGREDDTRRTSHQSRPVSREGTTGVRNADQPRQESEPADNTRTERPTQEGKIRARETGSMSPTRVAPSPEPADGRRRETDSPTEQTGSSSDGTRPDDTRRRAAGSQRSADKPSGISTGTIRPEIDRSSEKVNVRPAITRVYKPGERGVYRSDRRHNYDRVVRYHYDRHPDRFHRSMNHPLRTPPRLNITWNIEMYHFYADLYPVIGYWDFVPWYEVYTIPAYDAVDHIGQVRRVFGRVQETYYYPLSDEYFLYIGAFFPYQDFTVIIPGKIARRISRNPERYFLHEDIVVTGLITEYEERPEIIVKKRSQIERY